MPGVHAVLTHDDVPGQKTYGLEFHDQPVLASDRVRYFGEPVAIVAAEHPEQARRAAAAIGVVYEELPVVADMERATEMEPLHPDRPTMGHGYRDDPRPNVVRSHRHSPRRPRRGGGRRRRGGLRRRHPGPGVPRPRVGSRRPRRRRRRRHPRRDPVAARRPRPGSRLPRARSRSSSPDPTSRRRRRVRRPRGRLDADPRACPLHTPAGPEESSTTARSHSSATSTGIRRRCGASTARHATGGSSTCG